METGLAIIAFFVVIGPLIFFHELGHFLAARWFGITVEEFGIGYPPRMVTLFEQKGTRFTLNWIPLGGFMRPAGEDDPNIPGGLASASKLARFTVLAAGPAANMIAALLLLIGMYMFGAPEQLPGAQVALVEAESPAAEAGLETGDIIIRADAVEIETFDDLTAYIYSKLGEPITLTTMRGAEELTFTMTPRSVSPDGQGPTGIRIEPVVEIRTYGPVAAVGRSVSELGAMFQTYADIPRMIRENEIPARYLRPVSVIGISQMSGQTITTSVEQNSAWPIIQLTAYISVALAITNLLPIPALDGGRILFVIIEAIRGKRIDPEREMAIHFVGFAVLMLAMVVFLYLDIVDPLVQ